MFLFLLASATYAQDTPLFLPFMWASQESTTLQAGQSAGYHIATCSIPQYNGKSFVISADLPFSSWDVPNQMIVYMNIYNSSTFSGTPICTNKDNQTGNPRQEFECTFLQAQGEWYLQVTAGFGANIVFTVAVKLVDVLAPLNQTLLRSFSPPPPSISAAPPSRSAPLIQEMAIQEMVQIIFSARAFGVLTGSIQRLDFQYCPIQSTYSLNIVVVALDEKSAFTTAVCKGFTVPCDMQNSVARDTRPIAINQVPLSTTTKEWTAIEVAIQGWGDYKQMNYFSFSVSAQPVL